MYLYCSDCDWSQDDFWSKDYNSLRMSTELLQHYIDRMIEGMVETGMEEERAEQLGVPYKIVNGECIVLTKDLIRELVEYELKTVLKKFQSMKWITYKEFKDDPNKVCPNCGSKNLGID